MLFMNPFIYLDNSATTQVDPQIVDIIRQELTSPPGNASSWHSLGQVAKKKLLRSKEFIAKWLGAASPKEIIFTSGGTEGLNMLILGIANSLVPGEIISTAIEHPAVQKPLACLAKRDWKVTTLPVDEYGAMQPSQLKKAITPKTKIVILSAVNHETGVQIDVESMASICESYQIPFILDGVALLGKSPIQLYKGITAIAFSGHKIHALPGVGFVYLKSAQDITPLLHGGAQENGLRSGTENLLGILGLAKAIEILSTHETTICLYLLHLRNVFEERVLSQIPDVFINGTGPRIPNISNLYIKGVDAEEIVIQLDSRKIIASMGSACSSGNFEPSQVLINMGYSQRRASQSIRFSFSRFNSEEEVVYSAKILCEIVSSLRSQKCYSNSTD